MIIDVLMFAGAKEATQADRITIDLPDNSDAKQALAMLAAKQPELKGILPSCRLAVDDQYVGDDFVLNADQSIALIPPVSGG